MLFAFDFVNDDFEESFMTQNMLVFPKGVFELIPKTQNSLCSVELSEEVFFSENIS